MSRVGGRPQGKAGSRASKRGGAGGSRMARRPPVTTSTAPEDPESFEVLGEGD